MKGISIIIPVYNREKYIKEAVQSVLDQNYEGEFEVIVSDDGSTDRTLQIVAGFGNKVKLIKKEKNARKGPSAARNRGLRVARFPYIAFLDSDDFYLPGHLTRMVSVLENNDTVDYVFCRTLEVMEVDGSYVFRPWTETYLTKLDLKYPVISGKAIVNTNCFVFRKDVFNTVGEFNESLSNSEDNDMWMRITERFKGEFIDYYGVTYRVNHESHQLTKKSRELIYNSYKKVNAEAIERYHKLKIKDQYYILQLKLRRSSLKYQNNKIKHYIHCCYLMIEYPIGFFRMFPSMIYKYCFLKRKKGWGDLKNYNNISINKGIILI